MACQIESERAAHFVVARLTRLTTRRLNWPKGRSSKRRRARCRAIPPHSSLPSSFAAPSLLATSQKSLAALFNFQFSKNTFSQLLGPTDDDDDAGDDDEAGGTEGGSGSIGRAATC